MPHLKELKAIGKDISILYVEDDKMMRENVTNYLQLIFDDVQSA